MQSIADYGSRLFVERWPELIIGFTMLAFWRWFMGHSLREKIRNEFREEIGALKARVEAQQAGPPIMNIAIAGAQPDGIAEAIRRELATAETEQTTRLLEAIDPLTLHPLGNGHRYADLPAGTRAVVMKDGSVRLALPVRLSGHMGITGVGSAKVGGGRRNDDQD